MNPVVLYFASGDSLYAGAGLLLLVVVISRYLKQRRWLRLRNLAAWLGLALMVMACPPLSWAVDAIFLAAFVLWLIVVNQWLGWPGTDWRSWSAAALLVVVLTLTASELPRRRIPAIVGIPSDHLVVIGDSISSGIDSHVPAWPVVMQQSTNVSVKNLSRPGAQVAEGQDMAGKVTPDDRLVLIEIGGNDCLAAYHPSRSRKTSTQPCQSWRCRGARWLCSNCHCCHTRSRMDKFSGVWPRSTVSG